VVIASSQVTMNPFLGMKVPFKIESDFEPVGLMWCPYPGRSTSSPSRPGVHPVQQGQSGQAELQQPTTARRSTWRAGCTRLSKTGCCVYRGTGPSIGDLIGGQVQISFATYASASSTCSQTSCAHWASPGERTR
jgi:hypothetical protein